MEKEKIEELLNLLDRRNILNLAFNMLKDAAKEGNGLACVTKDGDKGLKIVGGAVALTNEILEGMETPVKNALDEIDEAIKNL